MMKKLFVVGICHDKYQQQRVFTKAFLKKTEAALYIISFSYIGYDCQ